MQDANGRWGLFIAIISTIGTGIWTWYDWSKNPAEIPFEPLLGFSIAFLSLIGALLFRQKEKQNQQEEVLVQQGIPLSVTQRAQIEQLLQKNDIAAALDFLKNLGNSAALRQYVRLQSLRLNNAEKAFQEGSISAEERTLREQQIREALLFKIEAPEERIAPNPGLVFRPQYAFFRGLFRKIPALDRRKRYFAPLLSKRLQITPKRLAARLMHYIAPSMSRQELPDISLLAEDVKTKGQTLMQAQEMLKNSVFDYFVKGVFKSERNLFDLILADSGVGKTSLLQQLYLALARTYPAEQLAFVYAGADTLVDIRSIPQPENTILFVDGIDEDARLRYNRDRFVQEWVGYLLQFKKVVMTCRTQFFVSEVEEWNRLPNSRIRFEHIHLPLFELKQAKTYANNKFAGDKIRQQQALKLIDRRQDLFRKPLLLYWMDLILSDIPSLNTDEWSNNRIFKIIVAQTAKREAEIPQGNYEQDLLRFSKALAISLYEKNETLIQSANIIELAKNLGIQPIDAQSRSFLTRDVEIDLFQFSHASFQDYFLAKALLEGDIREEDFPFERYPETWQFYLEMCWQDYAGQAKVPKQSGETLDLGNDLGLKNLGHPSIARALPHRVIRAHIIRNKQVWTNFNGEPFWSDILVVLKPLCNPKQLLHYVFEDLKSIQYAQADSLQPENYYQKQFRSELVIKDLIRTTQVEKNIHTLVLNGQGKQATSSSTEPGQALDLLLENNPLIRSQFQGYHTLRLQGIGIQSTQFLAQLHNPSIRELDLQNNQIEAWPTPSLQKLLKWPELRHLQLQKNPLPKELKTLVKADGAATLRAFRDHYLNPPPMVPLPGGTFMMGQPDPNIYMGRNYYGNDDYSNREQPVHQVSLAPFYLAESTVTLGEFRQFVEETGFKTLAEIDDNGSRIYDWAQNQWVDDPALNWRHDVNGQVQTNERHPVIHVCWYDAVAYCNWLSRKNGLPEAYAIDYDTKDPNNTAEQDTYKYPVRWIENSPGYRLPTEAEWEYAAQGPNLGFAPFTYAGSEKLDEVGWFEDNSMNQTQAVNQKIPVAWPAGDLHDLSGNVYEWCWDWYEAYPEGPVSNPTGAAAGAHRVLRGGTWVFHAAYCRVAYRGGCWPLHRDSHFGLRVARLFQ
jgi:formylglycine-generating enzyme required for sulfatase activity